jgi:GNAT superfamily N-acetyltransferase
VITLRHAESRDLSAVADLLYEVEQFYGATELPPREQWEEQISSLLFSDSEAARVLLAIVDAVPQGFASYSFLWPAAGVSKSLFLKELYVRDDYRKRGVGMSLISHLSSIAVETGSSRVEWTTDLSNVGAQNFYDKLGATPASNKIIYRVEGDDLIRLSRLRENRSQGPFTTVLPG